MGCGPGQSGGPASHSFGWEGHAAMNIAKKLCYDRILPRDVSRPHRSLSQGPSRVPRAISPLHKQWTGGQTITITFKGGTSEQKDMVRQFAPEWCESANLKFEFVTSPAATVRVSFDASDGAWSYIGTDNLDIPVNAATLNLGWQDQGVILHEFGHMIGTDFDRESIMLYAFPASWTVGGQGTDFNNDLSKQDKAFVGSTQMYPRVNTTLTEIPVYTGTRGSIASPGEQDIYRFVVGQAGDFVVETGGSTDVFLSLYGPNSQTRLVAENDDAGAGHNARIEASLQPGTYFVQVRHYSP